MCEILIKAIDSTHSDPIQDKRGCYKTGMPVVVMDDGHVWGLEERLPKFVVLKIPTISKDKVMKYIDIEFQGVDAKGEPIPYRRRLWNLSWAGLPASAKTKILATGELVIKAGTYTGTYDYTWTQVKNFIKQITNGITETVNL